MPSQPFNPQHTPKTTLPQRRAEGEGPRSLAEDSGLASGTENDAPLKPAPAEIKARSPHTQLPQRARGGAPMPAFTPAPYQSEQVTGAADAPLAKLPPKRSPGSFGPAGLPFSEPLKEAAAPGPLPPRQKSHQAREIAQSWKDALSPNIRLNAEKTAPFREFEEANFDPEDTAGWGSQEQDAEKHHSLGKRLVLATALLALPLLGFVIWQSTKREPVAAVAPEAVPPSAKRTLPAEEVRQAIEIARQFLSAATIEEKTAFVRHPESTAERMKAWHSEANPLQPERALRFDDRSIEHTVEGTVFLALTMEMEDYSLKSIALEKTGGTFKVDWESYVAWSSLPWTEYLSQRPSEPLDFRVAIEPDTYYNFAYADETQYICFKLTDPGNWGHCWGYCPLDSPVGLELNRLLRRARQNGNSLAKAILRLRFSEEGKDHNQVEIEAIIQNGWIKPEP